MERFNTQEKVIGLFAGEGCTGNENCCFITFKDSSRAKSGMKGGMEYPYDGILINKTENGIGMIYLKYKKAIFLKPDISNLTISEDPYYFISNSDICEITVKNHAPINKKLKSIIIKTADRKHCLLANINEPLLPYHNDNLAQFINRYGK